MDIKSLIRVIEDYPEKGISFKDITTLLKNKDGFRETIDLLEQKLQGYDFDYIAGVESRGLIFGAPLADRLNKGFIPIRKPGKLPGEIEKVSYDLEYGTNELEIHRDALKKGDKVVIIDDLIATGGSAKAAAKLVEAIGGDVVCFEFLIELTSLKGREVLKDYDVISIVEYDHFKCNFKLFNANIYFFIYVRARKFKHLKRDFNLKSLCF